VTPAARIQTSIELLDTIIAAARSQGPPADRILAEWFRGNRFAGSKDRRAIRETVYAAIRACGLVPESGRAAMLRLAEMDTSIASLFDGSKYGPEPIAEAEEAAKGGVAPSWLADRLRAVDINGAEVDALLERAPLDLRVNTLKANRERIELPEKGYPLAAPQALRFDGGTQVEQWQQYRDGLVEIQDHGSQLACLAVDAIPGETLIDLCAGAGGKTLALAARLSNAATLIAADTDARRLGNLAPRARRADAHIDHTVLLDPGKEIEGLERWMGQADHVLVDAPCSGTGTWRRNPEARWRLTPASLDRLIATQTHILDNAVRLLNPGGRLVYVVCSLLDEEGAEQFDALLARHPQLSPQAPMLPLGRERGKGIRLTPHHDGTDGFFIACAVSAC
jgi:16S rRNA (cytosine967-C5)-methyltransferase